MVERKSSRKGIKGNSGGKGLGKLPKCCCPKGLKNLAVKTRALISKALARRKVRKCVKVIRVPKVCDKLTC